MLKPLEIAVRPQGARASQAGFTLMELIVASLIASIVLAGMYTALGSTILAIRTGEAGIRNFQGARISMAMMEQELQCVIPGAELLFEGDDKELTFFAVTQPLDVEEGEHARIMRVRYRVKSDGGSREKILVREESVVKGPFPSLEPSERDDINTTPIKVGAKETFELASGIKNLQFSYYWLPSSGKAGEQSLAAQANEPVVLKENRKGWGLPQGIKIVLDVTDPNSENGVSSFTSFVAFQGPSTLLRGGLPGQEGSL